LPLLDGWIIIYSEQKNPCNVWAFWMSMLITQEIK
jgi:hypothetical protein